MNLHLHFFPLSSTTQVVIDICKPLVKSNLHLLIIIVLFFSINFLISAPLIIHTEGNPECSTSLNYLGQICARNEDTCFQK